MTEMKTNEYQQQRDYIGNQMENFECLTSDQRKFYKMITNGKVQQ